MVCEFCKHLCKKPSCFQIDGKLVQVGASWFKLVALGVLDWRGSGSPKPIGRGKKDAIGRASVHPSDARCNECGHTEIKLIRTTLKRFKIKVFICFHDSFHFIFSSDFFQNQNWFTPRVGATGAAAAGARARRRTPLGLGFNDGGKHDPTIEATCEFL